MTRERTVYVYGSTARAMGAEPLRRYDEERQRRQLERQKQRPRVKPKKRIDKVSVFLTCLTFISAMVIGISYLHLQFQSTYLSKSVVNLQSEVVEMEKENATAAMNLENSLNLAQIYKKATKELGMTEAKNNQVFTYESKKSTQVRQHGSIPTN
ncbi:MAG: hypothetical protein J1F02_09600 [Lachnospiraceae bacterium]|nr:hypothetical protein [Lachnospiraceae bacterium]